MELGAGAVVPVAGDVAEAIFQTFCWLAREPGGSLTVRQVATVLELSRMGKVDFGDTADRLGVSRPTLSRIVERLVDSGLVVRCQNAEDRRRLLLTVTPQGAQFANTLLAMRQPEESPKRAMLAGVGAPSEVEPSEVSLERRSLLLSGTLSVSESAAKPTTGPRRRRK